MPTDATILAVCSPPGRSARAVVRLSGPDVPDILSSHFGGTVPRGGHRAVLRMTGGGQLPVLLAHFPAPRSYTGEDVLEVQVPGNPALVERVAALLLATPNVRGANPGEFTARAFLNRKLTLDQAEGIALVIAAGADAEFAAARRLTSGLTGALYRAWSNELATLLALVEAGIDFTDQEDVVPIAPGVLRERVETLVREIGARLGARRGLESAGSLPRVALVGAPNAGKSTLFNALLGRRRAVTSPVAGTTRDILTEPLDLSRDAPGAGPVMLADLAGIDPGLPGGGARPVETAIDALARAGALEAVARADVLVHCDPGARFGPLPPSTAAVVHVRTKADLAHSSSGADGGDGDAIAVCALDGRNIAALRRRIALSLRGSGAGGEAILAPRHRAALTVASDRLGGALGTIDPGPRLSSPELTGGLLREALDALGELTGRISPDEIIGRVFATFCIGK